MATEDTWRQCSLWYNFDGFWELVHFIPIMGFAIEKCPTDSCSRTAFWIDWTTYDVNLSDAYGLRRWPGHGLVIPFFSNSSIFWTLIKWLECIVEQYPAQREAFSGYVFVPTTWMIGAMFFGVTLLTRKIMTPLQEGVENDHFEGLLGAFSTYDKFNIVFMGGILGTFLLTGWITQHIFWSTGFKTLKYLWADFNLLQYSSKKCTYPLYQRKNSLFRVKFRNLDLLWNILWTCSIPHRQHKNSGEQSITRCSDQAVGIEPNYKTVIKKERCEQDLNLRGKIPSDF